MSEEYNADLVNNPVSFAKKHFLYCCADPGYKLKVREHYLSVPSVDRICYWNILEEKEKKPPPLSYIKTNNMCFIHISKTPGEKFRPGYYLPWSINQIVKCTLKDKRPYDFRLKNGGADAFFTFLLTGCSVFIDGPPDQPTVYHANNAVGPPVEVTREKEREYVASDLETKWRLTKVPKSRDRILDKSPNRFESLGARALHAKRYLKNEKKLTKYFTNPYIKVYGMVFGVRTIDKWKFYFQQCMVEFSKRGIGTPKLLGVKEFWPGVSLSVVVIRPRVKTLRYWTELAGSHGGNSIAFNSITDEML